MLRRRDSTRKSRKTLARLDDVQLPHSKLKFFGDQLQNLNFLFERKLEEAATKRHVDEKKLPLATSVVERLIQRLVCSVGIIDPNFASKYLIHLHENNIEKTNLQYLLRLDNLSTPRLYATDSPPQHCIVEGDPEFPKSYARIRINPPSMRTWGIFTNDQGYLRRDKIQAKYVELLATAAASDMSLTPNEVDDSILCASPGKVVDAITLHHILRYPAEEHVYFGCNGNAPRFPDPRDFRLAIVDEPGGIRIRLEFLSPAFASITMNVRLLVGIETETWPSSTDFPARVPLAHPDCLLYNQSGQLGAYLVGYGVQSSAWQLRFPATEDFILKNYSNSSTVHSLLKLSDKLLEEIYEESARHQKYQYTYRILNSYVFKTALLHDLEKDFTNPTRLILNWSPRMLSTHMLRILDHLVYALKIQRFQNYFYSTANLLVNPGHLTEDDYHYESRRIMALLEQFYHLSIAHNNTEDFERYVLSQELELLLLYRWKELVDGLLPPCSTRGRRFCFAGTRSSIAYSQYTSRQIEYLALLFRATLAVHNNRIILLDEHGVPVYPDTCHMDASHDLVYIVVILMRQSKEHFLKTNPSGKVRRKLAANFDPCMARLVEQIRTANEMIIDDLDFVKVVLKWLYRVLDQNKRLLSPLLRPYLNILFVTSHGNAWFLESIKRRENNDEVNALMLFNRLVNEDRITPAGGLVDCVSKKWLWAKEFLDTIRDQPVRVVYAPRRGKVLRHLMSVPQLCESRQEEEKNANASSNEGLTNGVKQRCSNPNCDKQKETWQFSSLSKRNYFSTFLRKCGGQSSEESENNNLPMHCLLRDSSPLTLIFQQVYRAGEHRCSGDIVQTLMSMQKMNILNEIVSILPADDRNQLLSLLQRFNAEKRRCTLRRHFTASLSLQDYSESSGESARTCEKYTPTEESVGTSLTCNSSMTDSSTTFELKSMASSSSGRRKNAEGGCSLTLRHSHSLKL